MKDVEKIARGEYRYKGHTIINLGMSRCCTTPYWLLVHDGKEVGIFPTRKQAIEEIDKKPVEAKTLGHAPECK